MCVFFRKEEIAGKIPPVFAGIWGRLRIQGCLGCLNRTAPKAQADCSKKMNITRHININIYNILIVYSTGKLNKFVVKSHIDLPTFWNLLL